MDFIIGGANQGKRSYAAKKYTLKESQMIDAGTWDYTQKTAIACLYNYHLLVKRIKEPEQVMAITERILQENPAIVIITDEIGYGIVPTDKEKRLWRERTGRACCYLAEQADSMTRIVSGIPQILKKKQDS